MRIVKLLGIAFSTVALACGGSGSGETGETDSGTSNSDSDSDGESGPAECTDNGVEGCPCIDGGLCVAGLVCLSNLCVDPGSGGGGGGGTTSGGDAFETTDKMPSGEDSMGSATDDSDTDTGGPENGSCFGLCGQMSEYCWCDPSCLQFGDCCDDYLEACPGACTSNDDCADDEVCSATSQECVPVYGSSYWFYVDRWTDYGPVCWDAGDCIGADPFYKVYNGGDLVFTSSTVDNTGTASWATAAAIEVTDDRVFSVIFWDEDLADHDYITTWCPLNNDDACWVLTPEILHAGGWSGYVDDDDYLIELRFVAK